MARTAVTRIKAVLAAALILALVLIGQRVSIALYTVGLALILVVVVLTFTFNNVSEERPARRLFAPLLLTWAIVAVIFVGAYFLAPVLAQIGS